MIQPANKVKQHWLVTSHDKDVKLHAPRMLGHPPLITLYVFEVGRILFSRAGKFLGRFCLEFGRLAESKKASFSRSMAQQLYNGPYLFQKYC